jgi:hypothetical protein
MNIGQNVIIVFYFTSEKIHRYLKTPAGYYKIITKYSLTLYNEAAHRLVTLTSLINTVSDLSDGDAIMFPRTLW